MGVSTSGDPRLETMFGGGIFSEASARPVVAISRRRTPPWAFGAVAAAALLLFVALESRRAATIAAEEETKTPTFVSDPPPPLLIPADPKAPVQSVVTIPVQGMAATSLPTPRAPSASRTPSGNPMPQPPASGFAAPFTRQQGAAPMVIDSSGPPPSAYPPAGGAGAQGQIGPVQVGTQSPRVRATTLANPALTIPQGVLIPAVLETAFHSTSAGYARAIVSRDVRGFDGTKILIPRGSRLIGEYRGTIQAGQTRAVINWTRLIRGDGVTISLNSPAVDPMGRGGIRARVNNHLLERVTNTVLQSTIGVAGSLLRSNRNSVILAVPGSADAAQDAGLAGDTLRTLSVPAATSISVFVAQDLEFDEGMGRQ